MLRRSAGSSVAWGGVLRRSAGSSVAWGGVLRRSAGLQRWVWDFMLRRSVGLQRWVWDFMLRRSAGQKCCGGVRGALIVPGGNVAGGVQTPDVARLPTHTLCSVQQSSFRAGSVREQISAIFLLSTTKGKLRNSPPGATRSGRRFGGGAKRPPPNSLFP